MNYLRRDKSGFTIIEVVIVLAIAGLIMLIVFLAVPQLQRNARDTSRRAVVSRIKSEIETYASNNTGTYPLSAATCTSNGTKGEWCDLYNRYLTTVNIADPSGGNVISANPNTSAGDGSASYVTAYGAGMTLPAKKGVLAVIRGASCNGESVQASSGTNSYALVIGLDRDNTRYCVDNG